MNDTEEVISLEGDLTLDRVDDAVELLRALLDTRSRLAINLASVRHIDGAGLQALIAARNGALERDIEWRVVAWSRAVADLLDVLRCADLLDGPIERHQHSNSRQLVSASLQPGAKDERRTSPKMGNECWHISIRFGYAAFACGSDPVAVLARIRQKGEVVRIKLVHSQLPTLSAVAPRDCYLGLELDLRSRVVPSIDLGNGAYVFGAVPPFSPESRYVDLLYRLPEDPRQMAMDWWEMGSVTDQELFGILSSLAAENKSVHLNPSGSRQRAEGSASVARISGRGRRRVDGYRPRRAG